MDGQLESDFVTALERNKALSIMEANSLIESAVEETSSPEDGISVASRERNLSLVMKLGSYLGLKDGSNE